MKKLYYLGLFVLLSFAAQAQNFPYKSFYNHDDRVTAITFSPDSKTMASGGKDNLFILQDVFTRKTILKLNEHHEPINQIQFSPDGKSAYASSENVLAIFDIANSKLKEKFTNFTDVVSFEATKTGDKIYIVASTTADKNTKLYMLDLKEKQTEALYTGKSLGAVKLSNDDKFAYLIDDKGIVKIELANPGEVTKLNGHAGKVIALDYHAEKNKLVSCDAAQVLVWDLEAGGNKSFPYKKSTSVKWSRNGEYFATSIKNKVFLREVESSNEQPMFTGSNSISQFTLAPGGGFIATTAESTKVQLYENPWAKPDEIMKPPSSNRLITAGVEKTTTNYNPGPAQDNSGGVSGLSDAELAMLAKIREEKKNEIISDVDKDIPASNINHPYRFALIIGNEDYSTFQTDLTNEIDVDFAEKDARIFSQYANKTLGIPENNITLLTNATAGQMRQSIAKINKIAEVSGGQAEIFFYYAGHGLPDEVTKDAYLIPVDVSGTNVQYGIKLKDVYKSLTEHPTERVTVFLDACFSGGARNQGLLAARGVKIKPKEEQLGGKLVVFSASSGDQSSLPYKDKGHGMFTYYLLKKLQESGNDLSYRELSEFLVQKVRLESVLINSKEQDPQTNVSPSAATGWGEWMVK
jgi:hypothetical protein